MDQLGHVNNVAYVDYLQEGRVDMLRVHPPAPGGEALAAGVVVVRHEVQYVSPLVFRREPVSIELWVTEVRAAAFTMAYEIFDETAEGRRVYVRARSVLTPYVFEQERPRRLSAEERDVLGRFLEPAPQRLRPSVVFEAGSLDRAAERGHAYLCAVRFSDVDAYRHVNNVTYFEYYQEARIALLASLGRLGGGPADSLGVVVAEADVDFRLPMFFRAEGYVVETWVSRVGGASFVIDGQIVDDGTVLSRSQVVMVAFDPVTQRPRQLSAAERTALLAGPSSASG
jgi:acyl-CoA thioester hydrolase